MDIRGHLFKHFHSVEISDFFFLKQCMQIFYTTIIDLSPSYVSLMKHFFHFVDNLFVLIQGNDSDDSWCRRNNSLMEHISLFLSLTCYRSSSTLKQVTSV